METSTPADQTTPPALPPTGHAAPPAVAPVAHTGGKGCGCEKCEAKRKRWRARDLARRKRDNPFAGTREQSAPYAGSALAVLPGLAGAIPPAVPARPFVAWSVELVRPLVAKTCELLEKWDGESLMAEARKVSPRVAEFLAPRLPWDGSAKSMLVDGGAECAVKYLNAANISAEYAPEIKTGLAALSILYARQSLVAELRKMADEEQARKTAPAAPAVSEERKAA